VPLAEANRGDIGFFTLGLGKSLGSSGTRETLMQIAYGKGVTTPPMVVEDSERAARKRYFEKQKADELDSMASTILKEMCQRCTKPLDILFVRNPIKLWHLCCTRVMILLVLDVHLNFDW